MLATCLTVPPSSRRNYQKFMQWDITRACNLRCTHCRSTEFYDDGRIRDLPFETNKRIAEDLYLNGVRRIHFLGGEPLARGDFCDLAEYVQALGIDWSVNTNATLLTRTITQRLLRAQPSVITISLDGPDAESNDSIRGAGTFARVCRNTVRLTRLRRQWLLPTRIVISCTLVRQDAGRMDAMAVLARRLGVDSLILSSLRSMGRARESSAHIDVSPNSKLNMGEEVARHVAEGHSQHIQLGFLAPVAIQYLNETYGTAFPIYSANCTAITQKGYIQPDGAIFPCQSLTDVAQMPQPIGPVPRRSLADHGFEAIWNGLEMRRIEDALFDSSVESRLLPCRYCRYFKVVCYPCPLGALAGRVSVHLDCLEAMSRLSERRGYAAPWREWLERASCYPERKHEEKTP